MINSRKITDLRPAAARKCREWVELCAKRHIDVLVYCTFRDFEQQNVLYAQGRTTSGRKVTNAKGGQSFHNYQVAWDAVPMLGGKPQWNDKVLYLRMGEAAEELGIEWAGRWKSFKETAHFQYVKGLPLSHFKNGGSL